nr:unnamed protein product [Digitaria exilis]
MTEVLLLVDGGPMTEILLLLDGGLMAEDGGCNYWAWAEGPHSEFIQEMLRDLRNEVWRVKRKNGELKALMTEMEEKEKHKEKDIQAMRVTVSTMEKKLGMYKLVIKCGVFLMLIAVWNKCLFN